MEPGAGGMGGPGIEEQSPAEKLRAETEQKIDENIERIRDLPLAEKIEAVRMQKEVLDKNMIDTSHMTPEEIIQRFYSEEIKRPLN